MMTNQFLIVILIMVVSKIKTIKYIQKNIFINFIIIIYFLSIFFFLNFLFFYIFFFISIFVFFFYIFLLFEYLFLYFLFIIIFLLCIYIIINLYYYYYFYIFVIFFIIFFLNVNVGYNNERKLSSSSADGYRQRANSIGLSVSPSLDPHLSGNPPKRPLRYYEMNNQVNEGAPAPQAPSVPPRRHYNGSPPSMVGQRPISEILPPTPPRTNMSAQPANRRAMANNSSNTNNQGSTNSNSYGSEGNVNAVNEIKKSNTINTVTSVSAMDDSLKEDSFEDDFVYHAGDIRPKFPLVYHSANMSEIAANFRKRIKLVKHIKDSIEYMQSFSGYDAVTALADILGTDDRKVAQTTGQALEEQGMFHDVVYLHKLLDSHNHYYQFEDLAKPIAILERKETQIKGKLFNVNII